MKSIYIRILLMVFAALPTWTALMLGITGLIYNPLLGLTFLSASIIVVWFGIDTARIKK